MSVTIEQDLKEYLDQKFSSFEQRFDKVDQRLEKMQDDITDLKIGQSRLEGEIKRVETELKGEIKKVESEVKRVEEKVDGIGKRMEFQEFVNRGVLIGLIVAILGGLAKMFGIIGNP
jgi:predicted  nucleic acid-binding Zn-ribbon protein